MEGSLDYLINNMNYYYQPFDWNLYKDLIDTKSNLESISFYEWEYIENDIKYQDIKLLLNDFDNNINTIINLVKEIIIDNIKTDNRFEYCNDNKIKVHSWYLEGMTCCENCGNIWDGYAQCNCY